MATGQLLGGGAVGGNPKIRGANIIDTIFNAPFLYTLHICGEHQLQFPIWKTLLAAAVNSELF
jgi:hypothetical protein